MKLTLILVAGAVLFAAGWYSWELHFWTPPGQMVKLQTWNIGSYEFEVWQRKNQGWAGAFTTALFARSISNRVWDAFSIGHEDGYSPAIRLRRETSVVEVLRGRKRLGAFDLTKGTYLRVGQSGPIAEGTTPSPGSWWSFSAATDARSH